jgi:hypothetical protein
MQLIGMPARARFGLVSVLVVFVLALVAAHVLMAKMAVPAFTDRCPAGGGGMLVVHGFGSDGDPKVAKACSGGSDVPVTAHVDRASGELVLESRTPALAAFDGGRGTKQVRMVANTIDHSHDVWWGRLLEAATPFVDYPASEPFGGTDESRVLVEVGLPRAERIASGGSRATIDIGANADDESLTILVMARRL